MRRLALILLLLAIAAPARAEERAFHSATAESVLASCNDKADWHQGFCRGFIEAIAVRLADTSKSCAYWPLNIDSLVSEARDALAGAEKTAPAWHVVELRLDLKHLPPCK